MFVLHRHVYICLGRSKIIRKSHKISISKFIFKIGIHITYKPLLTQRAMKPRAAFWHMSALEIVDGILQTL